jgi:hypothetical protein
LAGPARWTPGHTRGTADPAGSFAAQTMVLLVAAFLTL